MAGLALESDIQWNQAPEDQQSDRCGRQDAPDIQYRYPKMPRLAIRSTLEPTVSSAGVPMSTMLPENPSCC